MLRAAMSAVIAASLGLLACGTPSWQQGDSTNKPRKNVVVQFTDSTLHPAVAQITQGGVQGRLSRTDERQPVNFTITVGGQ